jgi:RNA-binding protein
LVRSRPEQHALNKKKKEEMEKKLKGLQRQYLRGLAHRLNPVVQIGKHGVSDEAVAEIDQALTDHELIKIRFNEFKEDKKNLSAGIADRSGSELVGMIGNVAIFYRENPEKTKKIVIPSGQRPLSEKQRCGPFITSRRRGNRA